MGRSGRPKYVLIASVHGTDHACNEETVVARILTSPRSASACSIASAAASSQSLSMSVSKMTDTVRRDSVVIAASAQHAMQAAPSRRTQLGRKWDIMKDRGTAPTRRQQMEGRGWKRAPRAESTARAE